VGSCTPAWPRPQPPAAPAPRGARSSSLSPHILYTPPSAGGQRLLSQPPAHDRLPTPRAAQRACCRARLLSHARPPACFPALHLPPYCSSLCKGPVLCMQMAEVPSPCLPSAAWGPRRAAPAVQHAPKHEDPSPPWPGLNYLVMRRPYQVCKSLCKAGHGAHRGRA
jgi:hypothetical protein